VASNLIKTEPIWSSGTTSSGGYLSKGQRKALFKQQKISSSAFKSSSAIVSTGKSSGLISSAGSALARRPSISRVRPADIIPLFSGTKTEDGRGSKSMDLNAIAETLIETNRILVEIQRQLAIDFATRMVKEGDELKRIRLTVDRNRRERKEGKIEAGKLGFAGKVFDKALSPIKGLWNRLLGFFGWIAAGWLTNKAVNWLVKNPKAIGQFFDTVTKNWKLIAAIAGGLVLTSIVGKLWGAWVLVKGILGLTGISAGAGGLANILKGFGRSRVTKGSGGTRGLGSLGWMNPFGGRKVTKGSGGTRGLRGNKRLGLNRGMTKGVGGKGGKLLGRLGVVLDIANRKQAGQTNVQAGAGVGGGLLASTLLTMLLVPEPATSAIGALGLAALQLGGYVAGSHIADQITGVNNNKNLNPPDSSNSTTILPELNGGYVGGSGGGAVNVPAVGGDSIPFVEAVDPYNEWIPRSRNLLGLAV